MYEGKELEDRRADQRADTPRSVDELDAAWEGLARSIHADGFSVRDAIMVHRTHVERLAVDAAAADCEERIRDALDEAAMGEDL